MAAPSGKLFRALVLISALQNFAARAPGAEPPTTPAAASQPPPYEQFLVLPLRVHVLSSKELPDVDCHLSDADVTRILRKVNAIWHAAGIHWGLESIHREPAARQSRFRMARALDGSANLALFRVLFPEGSGRFDGLHVYYIHRFEVNGVWLGGGAALVQETARLREVPGGIDEPVPRVTAHELGHALGLPHRQAETNLLASGTTGTRLNESEIARAREGARAISGALTVPRLREAAREAADRGQFDRARRLWTWLSEVPGRGADEARRALEALATRPR